MCKIKVDELKIIVIDSFTNWSSYDVIAVDKIGKEMYFDRYLKDTNILKGEYYV